jgi:hypothetical protein
MDMLDDLCNVQEFGLGVTLGVKHGVFSMVYWLEEVLKLLEPVTGVRSRIIFSILLLREIC